MYYISEVTYLLLLANVIFLLYLIDVLEVENKEMHKQAMHLKKCFQWRKHSKKN